MDSIKHDRSAAGPPDDADRRLVRYLLGELPESDAGDLERAALRDGDLFDRLRVIEDDLVDAYARDELPARDRRSFEGRFLATAEGRSRVEMARSLALAVDRRPAPAPKAGKTIRGRFARHLAPSAGARRWALAASLVLAVGLTWVGRDLLRDPAGPGPPPAGREAITFLLTIGARGPEGVPRLVLPAGAGAVELQIDLEGDDSHRRFRARLESSSGDREVASWADVAAQTTEWGRAVTFELPADLLLPGRYLLAVDGLGEDDEVTELGLYELEVVTGPRG